MIWELTERLWVGFRFWRLLSDSAWLKLIISLNWPVGSDSSPFTRSGFNGKASPGKFSPFSHAGESKTGGVRLSA